MINYISAHDNQTLFDNNQYKSPIATMMADRVRINNLGMALISRLDCRRSKITKEIPKTISIPDYAGSSLALHPILQQSSADRIVRQSQYNSTTGTFTIPPRTTAVFLEAVNNPERE